MINEVSTNGGAGTLDAIELFNATGQVVDIGGWYLSDSANNLSKYEFPTGTTIPGNGYLVVDERSFNPTPQNPAPNHFALSGTNGDDVWLVVGEMATSLDLLTKCRSGHRELENHLDVCQTELEDYFRPNSLRSARETLPLDALLS